MITFFTTCKPFVGITAIHQANALRSWRHVHPEAEVLLFGNEPDLPGIAARLGVHHLGGVETTEYGTPLVPSLFSLAADHARHDTLAYVNADVILTPSLAEAVGRVRLDRYLVVGRRWDVDLAEPLDPDQSGWADRLRKRVYRHGVLHAARGMDYFVHSRSSFETLPPLAVGRAAWDNWMVYDCRRRRVPVVDATGAVLAVHQNHAYDHVPWGRAWTFEGPEAERNREILGGWDRRFTTQQADWILSGRGLRRCPWWRQGESWSRAVEVHALLHPWLLPIVRWRTTGSLARHRLRRWSEHLLRSRTSEG